MELKELYDKKWNQYEKRRFLNDDTKISTDGFDPESFKHEGFDDREKFEETYVPALANEERLELELNNFTPPRLYSINDSPYQALVIRYGILRILIEQHDFQMEKSELLESVKTWQQEIIQGYDIEDFSSNDPLLHLAKAASQYKNDINDSELNMISNYFKIRNQELGWKHNHLTWLDFFKRCSAIERFPKVSRSEKPSHAIDTIEKGLWSLQEQAITYEIVHPERGNLAGIPEDYGGYIKDWLYYEMSDENFLAMLEELDPFSSQSNLIKARDKFGIETPTQGLNEKRRESLVEAGVFPSELMAEIVDKEELKSIIDKYGLDAHKRRTNEMIEATIEYFEQSQSVVDEDEPTADLYLKCYQDIADGRTDRIPPQLQGVVADETGAEKLEILFEQGTAEIFDEIFNLSSTNLLGQSAGGNVADGEIEQDGDWLLWDNKRRASEFKLGSNTQAKIKDYIDTKSHQHNVKWFLIIAPEFSDSAQDNALGLEKEVEVDIRLVRAEDFMNLATFWRDTLSTPERELPLTTFTGTGELRLNVVKDSLKKQFS